MTSYSSDGKLLRVVFVGARDSGGGAARATYRIFDALWQRREELGLDISMRVIQKTTDHPGIIGGEPEPSDFQRRRTLIVKRWRRLVRRKKFFSPHTIYSSSAEFDTGLGQELLDMNADLYVLNWLGSKTLSIREIGKLGRKVVWLLHDMWAFSGAEHYRADNRASTGYSRSSRPSDEVGPDVNRQIYRKKKRHWQSPHTLIVPSSWLASEAKNSLLTRNWPIYVQPFPLDIEFWKAEERAEARDTLGFSPEDLVILFGAAGGTKHQHKGADLLFEALKLLGPVPAGDRQGPAVTLAIFGEMKPSTKIGKIPVRFLGDLEDDGIKTVYSAADILVVPSRLENFAQVALEGHACGLPAVVFEGTGLTDIVENGTTGFHAEKDNPADLADKIQTLLDDSDLRVRFGQAAAERAAQLWHPRIVAEQYASIFRELGGIGRSSVPRFE